MIPFKPFTRFISALVLCFAISVAVLFLVLRRDSVVVNETAGIELPVKQLFSDYRKVDGIMAPSKLSPATLRTATSSYA